MYRDKDTEKLIDENVNEIINLRDKLEDYDISLSDYLLYEKNKIIKDFIDDLHDNNFNDLVSSAEYILDHMTAHYN